MISSGEGRLSLPMRCNLAPGGYDLWSILGDEDRIAAEYRADTLFPDVARDGQHHARVKSFGGSGLRPPRGHDWRIEAQPQPVRDGHRWQRFTGHVVSRQQI